MYLVEEVSTFCTNYFEPHVKTKSRKVDRNDDGSSEKSCSSGISSFNYPRRPSGASRKRFLNDKQYDAAALYVLLDVEKIQPFVK